VPGASNQIGTFPVCLRFQLVAWAADFSPITSDDPDLCVHVEVVKSVSWRVQGRPIGDTDPKLCGAHAGRFVNRGSRKSEGVHGFTPRESLSHHRRFSSYIVDRHRRWHGTCGVWL
jgi:hypothetical protein